jgi:DNA-binding MarR family transcriptional regulator
MVYKMAMLQKTSPDEESRAFNEKRGRWIDYVSERTDLTPAVRLTGIWIARRINWRTDDTWYQVSTIALRIGQTPRNIIRAIQKLESENLLRVYRDGRRGVKKAVNRYELVLPWDANVTSVSPCGSDTGVT